MSKTLNYNVKKRGGTWVLEDSLGNILETSSDPGRLQRQRQELYQERRALRLEKEGEGGSVSGGDATITTKTGLTAYDLEGQRRKKTPRTRKVLSDPDGILSPDEMADIALAMEKNWDGPDAAELIASADDSLRKTDKFKRCVSHVMDSGKSEDSAYAICTSVLGPHGRGKDRKKMRSLVDLRKFAPPGAADTVTRFFTIDMTKRDDEQQIVIGLATSERIDGQDEIVDSGAFKAAVPDFMEWANLREMHENKAAGKVLSIEPIEGEIEVDGRKIVNPVKIVAKIFDKDAWEKVKSGVYKGFSIGGKVVDWVNETVGGKAVRRITDMILTEISLVDRPANEDARILMYKRATDPLPETIEIDWDQLGEGQYNFDDPLTKTRFEIRPIPGGKFSVLIAKYDGAPVASFLADDLEHATLQAGHNLSVMRFRAGLAKTAPAKSQERPEDDYLTERGFDPMEAPVDWREWDDKRLKMFPITRALLDYRNQEKKAGRWTNKAAPAPLTKADKRLSDWEELPSGQLRATVDVTEDDGQTRTVYASVYKNVNGKWIGGVYYDASGNKPIKESAGQKEIEDAKAWVVEWARTEKLARPALRKVSVADFKPGATVTFSEAGEARKFFEALEKEANGGEELVDRPILNDVLEDFEKLGEGTLTVERGRQAAIITVANADDSDGERIKVWLPESMMAAKAARPVTIRKADDFPTAARAFVTGNPVGVSPDVRKLISEPARLADDFEAKKRDLTERRDAQALAVAQREYERDLRDAVAEARDALEKIVADEKVNANVRQDALEVLALKMARARMRKYDVTETDDVQHYIAITGYKVSRSDRRKLEAELARQKKANPDARIEINVRGVDRANADITLDVDGKTVLQVQGFAGQEIAYAAKPTMQKRRADMIAWMEREAGQGDSPEDLADAWFAAHLDEYESDRTYKEAVELAADVLRELGYSKAARAVSVRKAQVRPAPRIVIRKAQTYEFGRWQVDEAERMANSIGVAEAPRVKDFIKTLQETQDRTATLAFVVDEEKGYADVTLTNGRARKDARVTLGIVREKAMANTMTRRARKARIVREEGGAQKVRRPIVRKAAFPAGLMDEVKEIIDQEVKGWGAGGFNPDDLSTDLLGGETYNFETLPEGENLSDYFSNEQIDSLINEALTGVIKADADAAVAEYGSYKVKGTGFDTELEWNTNIGYASFSVWIHWDDDAWKADVGFNYGQPEDWSKRFDTLVEAAKYGYDEAERVQENLSEQGLETADVSEKAITDAVDKAVASFGDEGPDDLDEGVDQVLEIVRNDLEFYGTETEERIREEARRELERVYDYEAAAKPKMTKTVPAPKSLKRAGRTPAKTKTKAARPAMRKEADWSSPGPGKFEGRGGKLAQRLYSELMEGGGGDETLDFGEGEVYDLILDNTGVEEYGAAFILTNDSNGFVGVQAYKSEAEARAAWAELEAEYDEVMGEGDEEYEAAAKPRTTKRAARRDPVIGTLRREVSKLNAALREQTARLEEIERQPANVPSPYLRPAGKVEKRLPGQGNVLPPPADPQTLINERFAALVELRRQAAVEPNPIRKAELNRRIIAEEMTLGTLGQGGVK